MKWVVINMCGIVIRLYCLDVSSDSVVIDASVKWPSRISISQGMDKVTCVFQLAFFSIFALVTYWVHSLSFHDRDLVLWNDFLQCSRMCCIVETINPRKCYEEMWDLDLPWIPIDIYIASIKGNNGGDLLPFTWWTVVFIW